MWSWPYSGIFLDRKHIPTQKLVKLFSLNPLLNEQHIKYKEPSPHKSPLITKYLMLCIIFPNLFTTWILSNTKLSKAVLSWQAYRHSNSSNASYSHTPLWITAPPCLMEAAQDKLWHICTHHGATLSQNTGGFCQLSRHSEHTKSKIACVPWGYKRNGTQKDVCVVFAFVLHRVHLFIFISKLGIRLLPPPLYVSERWL